MERSKVRPTDNVRTFYLARFFIEYLLILREKAAAQNGSANGNGKQKDGISLGLVGEMAELDSVRWVVMRMKSTMDDEDDVEVAEILQNQLYYNGDILDSSLAVISGYKDQSLAYVDQFT
jgi:replication fork protection complex subunit Tof1/Swi1